MILIMSKESGSLVIVMILKDSSACWGKMDITKVKSTSCLHFPHYASYPHWKACFQLLFESQLSLPHSCYIHGPAEIYGHLSPVIIPSNGATIRRQT